MTTEEKALAMVNEVTFERGYAPYSTFSRDFDHTCEALCRSIEQHEAFRQEVSDAVSKAIRFCKDGLPASAAGAIGAFVIPAPKPDPLEEILEQSVCGRSDQMADRVRAALDARGLEIREKNDD